MRNAELIIGMSRIIHGRTQFAPTTSRHIHRVGTTIGRPQSENLPQKLEIHIMRNYIIWIRHIVGDGVPDVPCNA